MTKNKGTASRRLNKIKLLNDYKLEAEFIDGTHGFVEMKSLIESKDAGIFAGLLDVNVFNRVYLNYGVATWPNEIDLAPDAMYEEIKRNGTSGHIRAILYGFEMVLKFKPYIFAEV